MGDDAVSEVEDDVGVSEEGGDVEVSEEGGDMVLVLAVLEYGLGGGWLGVFMGGDKMQILLGGGDREDSCEGLRLGRGVVGLKMEWSTEFSGGGAKCLGGQCPHCPPRRRPCAKALRSCLKR